VDKVTGYTDRDLLPLPFLLHAANNHPLVGLLAERCGLQRMILSRTMRSRVILQNLVLALAMNIVFAGAKLAGTVDTSCTYTSTGPGSHSMSSGSTSDFSGVLSAKLQKTMVGSVVVMACMLPTGMVVDALAEVAQRWRLCPCGVVAELAAVVLLTAAVAAEILMQVSGTALGIKIVLYAATLLSTLQGWAVQLVVVPSRWAVGHWLYPMLGPGGHSGGQPEALAKTGLVATAQVPLLPTAPAMELPWGAKDQWAQHAVGTPSQYYY
jgi:hypothetical protein